MSKTIDFASLRLETPFELDDAYALGRQTLEKTMGAMGPSDRTFSLELFAAVTLALAKSEPPLTLKKMVDYLADPLWDTPLQILYHLAQDKTLQTQPVTAEWQRKLLMKVERMPQARVDALIRQCHAQWTMAGESIPCQEGASLQLFEPEAILKAKVRIGRLSDEINGASGTVLDDAHHRDGFRSLPDLDKALSRLSNLRPEVENLAGPLDRLQTDLTLAKHMLPADFRITPILLLGDPGIGKTYLASRLAEGLGVPIEKMSAGGAQGGFQLTGSHTSWKGARPGALVSLLASGDSTSPVVLIDEVDKIADSQYPVLPVLLDLLEPDSGKRFKDEFFEMTFDASRIFVVLTANQADRVPVPLLSRVEVFDVPRPDFEQRRRIIHALHGELRAKTGHGVGLDLASCDQLAERCDLDLRVLGRLVREGFAKALQSGGAVSTLSIPKLEERRPMRFV